MVCTAGVQQPARLDTMLHGCILYMTASHASRPWCSFSRVKDACLNALGSHATLLRARAGLQSERVHELAQSSATCCGVGALGENDAARDHH